MDKNEIRHRLKNEIEGLDIVIKQFASVRHYVTFKQDRFGNALGMLINISNEMRQTLNELNNESTNKPSDREDSLGELFK